jgi:hypothetical protein
MEMHRNEFSKHEELQIPGISFLPKHGTAPLQIEQSCCRGSSDETKMSDNDVTDKVKMLSLCHVSTKTK